MQEKEDNVCTKPFDAETSRLEDEDEPCENGEVEEKKDQPASK